MFFRQSYGNIKRLRQILGIFFDEGFDFFIERANLKYFLPWRCRLHCFWQRLRRREQKKLEPDQLVPPPTRVRRAFEKLGPTFVKLGQVLSQRPDLVGEAYAEEFKKLQDAAPPFSYNQAREVIRGALGEYPEKLFKDFDAAPVAAASLAQVHKARLPDGSEVAVKVQRPGIKKIIENDIQLILYLAGFIEKHILAARPMQPVKIVKEFADWTMRELDFTVEGVNADHFRYNFRDNEKIYIPQIYWSYTKSAVLTMEYIHGLKADNLAGLKKKKISPNDAALVGVRAFFQMIFLDGFFHADPHPGNLFILNDGRVCLHDWGMVGFINEESRGYLLGCFEAMLEKNAEKYIENILRLARPRADAERGGFETTVKQILNSFFYSPSALKDRSLARAFYEIIMSGARHGVLFNTDLVLLGRALLTLEGLGRTLYPEFDFKDYLGDFMSDARSRQLSPENLARQTQRYAASYLDFLKQLPSRTQKLMEALEKGEVAVKIDTRELREFTREFDRQNDIRVFSFIVIAVFLASIIALNIEGWKLFGLSLGRVGLGVSAALFLWLLKLLREQSKFNS